MKDKALDSQFLFFVVVAGQKADPSKHVLLMDEVDGMAGNEDRGGMQVRIKHDCCLFCLCVLCVCLLCFFVLFYFQGKPVVFVFKLYRIALSCFYSAFN